MLCGFSTQSFGLHQAALIDDELVHALPRNLEVLGEPRLAPGDERASFEHVPDRFPELLSTLGVTFGHVAFSDTLDTGKNGVHGALLRRLVEPRRSVSAIDTQRSGAAPILPPAQIQIWKPIDVEARMANAESIRELLDKMTSEREALLSQAEAMDPEAASYAPPDGEGEAQWSPKQQLAHLAEMETSYRAWVRKALDEDSPDLTGVIGERPAISLKQAQDHDVASLTAQLRDERVTTLALIRAMTPDQFERTASQPMFGSLTVMQWLRSYYRHDRMHVDQMAGRDPAYKPKFVDGAEPDQRRGPRV